LARWTVAAGRRWQLARSRRASALSRADRRSVALYVQSRIWTSSNPLRFKVEARENEGKMY
jgi:hypothetical protein